MFQEKYIPYYSYIDICRVLCEHTGSPILKSDLGYETFIPPMNCFYARSFITAKSYDLEAIVSDLSGKIKTEQYPAMLSLFANDAPENYKEILEHAGFFLGFNQAAMYGHLDSLKPFPNPPRGEARRITPDELEEWKVAMSTGFGRGEPAVPGLYEQLIAIDNLHIYGWFVDGRIVGTMMAVENGDITGLHEGTVLPEFRRQGIITALILKGAEDFRPNGINIASMQASAMGAPVYASLGFKETGFIETWIHKN